MKILGYVQYPNFRGPRYLHRPLAVTLRLVGRMPLSNLGFGYAYFLPAEFLDP